MQDPRGNLTLTYLGLADKLKPKWIVYENVPGLLSSNGGRDFGSFLGALVQLGYGFAYRVLDAQYVGGPRAVPQRRRRVFVVACLGDWRAPAEVLSLREGLRGYLETGNKKRKGVAADAGAGIKTSGERVATPFRKSKRACSTTDNETWVPADASNTLNNFDLGDTRTTHAIVEPQVYENHAQDSRVTGPLDVAPTVTANFGTGGGNVPLVGAMAVRRLTPVECERLQGFPDNWSRISWKGKPEEECPDGPRYKACGNSMAVPVMRWIGERIAAVDSTLSSHA
jgi:DNA (cytosine-5)-methyltransferase 1